VLRNQHDFNAVNFDDLISRDLDVRPELRPDQNITLPRFIVAICASKPAAVRRPGISAVVITMFVLLAICGNQFGPRFLFLAHFRGITTAAPRPQSARNILDIGFAAGGSVHSRY
jgi:hypothetical protein